MKESKSMRDKRIYISGPMTGLPELNKPAFLAAEDLLREFGFKYFANPAKLKDEGDYRTMINLCMRLIRDCDVIYMLRDWRTSKGAILEMTYAMMTGMDVTFEEPFDYVGYSMFQKSIKGNFNEEKYKQN